MFRFVFLMSVAAWSIGSALAQESNMSFFVTSENPGYGGDLGGLEGADEHCNDLASSAGIYGKTWRAYLSASTEDARDRIGDGPWYNYYGELIAEDVEHLHSEDSLLTKETARDEEGYLINGRGDKPSQHDMLTGSDKNGRLKGSACDDWTSSNDRDSAMVGHHDHDVERGTRNKSWNSAHDSRGCSLKELRNTKGVGLFYCFAVR